MGKNKVLVKVHPEGKYVVDLDKNINMADVSTGVPTPIHFIMQEHSPYSRMPAQASDEHVAAGLTDVYEADEAGLCLSCMHRPRIMPQAWKLLACLHSVATGAQR